MWRQQALLPVFWLGCGHQWPEVDVAGDGLYSGQFGRRDGIRQARNRAGRPAVCRRSTWNGASRRHPYICSSQRPCQPTLWCAVCLLLCRRRRLPRRLTRLRSCRQRWLRRERRAVCVCVRCLRFLACAVASNAHWRRQAFGRIFWHVCCCCVCAAMRVGRLENTNDMFGSSSITESMGAIPY